MGAARWAGEERGGSRTGRPLQGRPVVRRGDPLRRPLQLPLCLESLAVLAVGLDEVPHGPLGGSGRGVLAESVVGLPAAVVAGRQEQQLCSHQARVNPSAVGLRDFSNRAVRLKSAVRSRLRIAALSSRSALL